MAGKWIRGLVGVIALSVAACAEVPADPDDYAEYQAANDPLEPMNRAIFSFNVAVDDAVFHPIATGYREMVPEMAQRSVHNFLNNLRAPFTLANDILQGEATRAGQTIGRFMVNSTFGVLGLFDVAAADNGPAFHASDFGQTLGVWGVGDGPYLMLPILGPSNPRDAVGRGVEFFADPTDLYLHRKDLDWAVWTRFGVGAVDDRAALLAPIDDLRRSALDFYASIRSVYRQRRAAEIAHKDLAASDGWQTKGAAPTKK